jgi:hypothetical protein
MQKLLELFSEPQQALIQQNCVETLLHLLRLKASIKLIHEIML